MSLLNSGAPLVLPDLSAATSLHELRFALRQCQHRLGTAEEEPTDFDRARELAHAVNNYLQHEYLRAAMRGAA